MPIMHGLQHRHTLLYTSNLLGFRMCRPHLVVNDASPAVSRSISSDCRAVHSSVGRWCRLVGVTPCRTGTVLFCRQGVGGFGTDPQMTAVPSIASFVCFHLKWARVVIALFTLACLHTLTLSVLAAYELCRLHEVSSSIGARMAR